jgi:hypothetical protein
MFGSNNLIENNQGQPKVVDTQKLLNGKLYKYFF